MRTTQLEANLADYINRLQQRAAFEASLARLYLHAAMSWGTIRNEKYATAIASAVYYQGASSDSYTVGREALWDDT